MTTPELSNETYSYRRSLPIEQGYDVVVVGAGPAGSAAAICAGRLGAKVLLVEATGSLGGLGTGGMVSNWSDTSDGNQLIVGGIMEELIEEMYRRGNFRPGITPDVWRKRLHSYFGYNSEGLKFLLDQLCQQAGVEIRFFTRLIDVDFTGQTINGIVINNVEGNRYIKAKAFIDATGDAVLTNLCGARCDEAIRDHGKVMPSTLCSAQAGIDWAVWTEEHLASNKVHLQTPQQMAVYQAIEEGFFTQPDRHVPGLFRNGRTTAIMNAGHVFDMNALKIRSLSDGMMKGRELAQEYVRFFRKYLKGCENMEFVGTASLMGVRESRKAVGEYILTGDDYSARRSFPDQIAVYNKPIDRHRKTTSPEEFKQFAGEFIDGDRHGIGEFYGVPYGILVPKGWNNLWVAGRCASADDQIYASLRDQPPCFMMGQGAATAAVQSVRTGQPACDLDTEILVETLRSKGCYLPQKSSTKKMTRTA